MKKILLCLGLIYGLNVGAQTVQTVDISTGVSNSGGGLLSLGANEDTWTSVAWPGNPPAWYAGSTTPRCTSFPAYWSDPGCARWITPAVHPTLYYPLTQAPTTYTYTMTFTANSGCVATAWLHFNSIGGDDQITAIKVNGYNHAISGCGFNPPSSNMTIPLTQSANSEINPGASNTIEVVVSNTAGGQQTGLYLCGDINIAYGSVTPTITTATSTFCAGTPLTFSSSVVGHASSHFWEIAECDAVGNVIPGGYVWNNGFAFYQGDPGMYTFPVSPTCGKYYKIKLAVLSQCSPWVETNKVIYIACNPTANAGADQTICSGDCATITNRTGFGYTYLWQDDAGVVATSASVTLCPISTTTYTYTLTNSYGCAASDDVTINVLNDPSFIYFVDRYSTYYNLEVVPTDLNELSQPGFTYSYLIQEMNGGTPYYNEYGTGCWQQSYATDPEMFLGFVSTGTGTRSMMPGTCSYLASTLTYGQFLYGHSYRITRTVTTTACGTATYYADINATRSMSVPEPTMTAVPQHTASPANVGATATSVNDLAQGANDFSVYPNPSTGSFTIETTATGKASIEIYDVLGNKVKAFEQNGLKSTVDLSGYPKGMYMINVITNGKKVSKKIILE